MFVYNYQNKNCRQRWFGKGCTNVLGINFSAKVSIRPNGYLLKYITSKKNKWELGGLL